MQDRDSRLQDFTGAHEAGAVDGTSAQIFSRFIQRVQVFDLKKG